jgi:hypothetical protein
VEPRSKETVGQDGNKIDEETVTHYENSSIPAILSSSSLAPRDKVVCDDENEVFYGGHGVAGEIHTWKPRQTITDTYMTTSCLSTNADSQDHHGMPILASNLYFCLSMFPSFLFSVPTRQLQTCPQNPWYTSSL